MIKQKAKFRKKNKNSFIIIKNKQINMFIKIVFQFYFTCLEKNKCLWVEHVFVDCLLNSFACLHFFGILQ